MSKPRPTGRKVRRHTLVLAGAVFGSTLFGGCASPADDDGRGIPEIRAETTRPHSFTGLGELAQMSTAIVVARPTGNLDRVALPEGHGPEGAAPTTYVEMAIDLVLEGRVSSDTVRVVANVDDLRTGEPVLTGDGPFLLFLAPAMYGAGDPAGGYVVAGGPSGMYAPSDTEHLFLRIDQEADNLPESIDLTDPRALPQITASEGPRLRDRP